MPIMDGFEASRRIMNKIKQEHYCCSIIIGYTALIGYDEERASIESGMADII